MTVTELFNYSIGEMGISISNASTYTETILPQVNNLLAECFKLENNNRLSLGVAELTEIPLVTSLTDTLTYQSNIIRNVMMYGLCQKLALTDDDTLRAGYYGSKYAQNSSIEMKANFYAIPDYYSGEEEE